jgi:hypothetical protein
VPRIEIFHNISRDASFGLNTVFRTGDVAPEGMRSLPLSGGRVGWKDFAETPDEMHPLVKVFEYEREWIGDRADVCAILHDAFERFNNGSGHEDAAYFASKLRSLSVGDVVFIDDAGYSCESSGWDVVSRFDLRILTTAEAEPVIRERYEFKDAEDLSITVPLAD